MDERRMDDQVADEVNNRNGVVAWVKAHRTAIMWTAGIVGATIGIVIWGLLPEKESPVKEEWIAPVKRNWYMESED